MIRGEEARMGCAPGGDCCDSCRSHTGPPIGRAADHVHSMRGVRNVALHRALGDVVCDDEGQNCYEVTATVHYDGVTDDGTTPPTSTAASSPNKALLFGGIAVLAGVLLFGGSSRRR